MPSRVLCTRSPENMPNTFLFLKGLKEGGKEEYWGAKTERKNYCFQESPRGFPEEVP